tara:strand:- start:135416 stop:136339 length:924 start_codon:yes stop_codon:yes gene_type:complete
MTYDLTARWIVSIEGDKLFMPCQDWGNLDLPKDTTHEEDTKKYLKDITINKNSTRKSKKNLKRKQTKRGKNISQPPLPPIIKEVSPGGIIIDTSKGANGKKSALSFKTLDDAKECYRSAMTKALHRVNVFTEKDRLESTFTDAELDGLWQYMAEQFCSTMIKDLMGLTSTVYYQSLVDKFVREYVLETAREMIDSKILDTFDSNKFPMCLSCVQTGPTDVIPQTQFMVPVKPMIDAGLLPDDIIKYNPFGTKLVCYSLFWSVHRKLAIIGFIHENESATGIVYEFYSFNRSTTTMNDLFNNSIMNQN